MFAENLLGVALKAWGRSVALTRLSLIDGVEKNLRLRRGIREL
jgi:hypothetical protein